MDEIGIQLAKEDPTFPSVVSEKTRLLASLPQAEEELYGKWKRLEGHEEFLDLQEVRSKLSYNLGGYFDLGVGGRGRERTTRVGRWRGRDVSTMACLARSRLPASQKRSDTVSL